MSSPDADPARPMTPEAAVRSQPAPPAPSAAATTRRRGTWRSLVISMVLLSLVVFAFVALVPRPTQRERVTVDLARSASQLAAEKGWPLAVVRTGEDWHPTSVSFAADDSGVPTWEVGYHSRPGDIRYVVLAQVRPGDGVTPDQVDAWVTRQSRQSRTDGFAQVAGRTWERRSVVVKTGAEDRIQRALVARGANAPGGLVTVLSGEVDYATLETFAAALDQTPLQASGGASPSSSAPSTSSSATSSPL